MNNADQQNLERKIAAVPPGAPEPAPTPLRVSSSNLEQLLAECNVTALNEVQDLRNGVDSLIESIKDRHSILMGALRENTKFIEEAIAAKKVMAEALEGLKKNFDTAAPATPKRAAA